jgi:hypothetical protein
MGYIWGQPTDGLFLFGAQHVKCEQNMLTSEEQTVVSRLAIRYTTKHQ